MHQEDTRKLQVMQQELDMARALVGRALARADEAVKIAEEGRELAAEVRAGNTKFNRRVENLKSEINALAANFDTLDRDGVLATLKASRNDAADLHRRLRALLLRFMVIGEVGYFTRGKADRFTASLHRRVLAALDNSDEWWAVMDELPLREVINRLTAPQVGWSWDKAGK